MSKETAGENYVILSVITLSWIGFSASMLFISLFLLQVKHVPLSEVGLVYLVSGVTDIIGQLIGGRLSDYFGTKTIALVGISSSTVVYALMALFVLSSGPVAVYFILYPLLSLSDELLQVPISSYLSDRQRDQMTSGLSVMYVGLNFGLTLGPVTGGLLIHYAGYFSLFASGALTAATAGVIFHLKIKSNPRYALRPTVDKSDKPVNRNIERGLYPFLILVVFSFMAIGFQAIPLSVFEATFLSLSSVQIGIVLSTNGLIITIFQIPISRLISIQKNLSLIPVAIGSLIMAAGFLLISRSTDLILLEGAISLTTLGEMLVSVPTNVVITLFSKENNRGKYQSFYAAFARAGSSASSYLGPLMFALLLTNSFKAWYIIAVLSAATGFGYLAYSPALRRQYRSLVQGQN